jgi:hypothetical protein
VIASCLSLSQQAGGLVAERMSLGARVAATIRAGRTVKVTRAVMVRRMVRRMAPPGRHQPTIRCKPYGHRLLDVWRPCGDKGLDRIGGAEAIAVQAISGLGLALEACEDAAMVGTGGDVVVWARELLTASVKACGDEDGRSAQCGDRRAPRWAPCSSGLRRRISSPAFRLVSRTWPLRRSLKESPPFGPPKSSWWGAVPALRWSGFGGLASRIPRQRADHRPGVDDQQRRPYPASRQPDPHCAEPKSRYLYAATYGRGIWRTKV